MTVARDISTSDPLVVTLGVPQTIYDIVLAPDGSTQNLSGATAVFFMRPLLSRAPVVNSAPATVIWPVDAQGHNVTYTMQSSDAAIEGEFSYWWGYVPSGGTLIETPESRLIITDHGPGYGSQTGVVVDGISMWMPVTLRALREDPDFGDRFLQKHADYVKRIVIGTVVVPDLETTYDPLLVEYLSKRTAVRLITPARDYWARQYRTVQTQGPSEMASYPDMLANLDELHKRLSRELISDWLQLQSLGLGLQQLRIEPAPVSSLGDPAREAHVGPVTGDPQAMPPARTGGPHWGSVIMP